MNIQNKDLLYKPLIFENFGTKTLDHRPENNLSLRDIKNTTNGHKKVCKNFDSISNIIKNTKLSCVTSR